MPKQSWFNFIDQLAYICPMYMPEGDGTEIADGLGSCYRDKRNIRSIRKVVCRHFALDYSALRKRFREQGGTGLAPMMLAPGYTLVAVKTRVARCPGDPCYGFVNLHLITSVEELVQTTDKSKIIFQNGLSLGSTSEVQTIKHAMLVAKSMEIKYRPIEQRDSTITELFQRFIKLLEKENQVL